MNKQTARRMGEEAGINWLTVMDSGEQLAAFATAVEQAQRREIERVLRDMLARFDAGGNAVTLEAIAAVTSMGERE